MKANTAVPVATPCHATPQYAEPSRLLLSKCLSAYFKNPLESFLSPLLSVAICWLAQFTPRMQALHEPCHCGWRLSSIKLEKRLG